MDGPAPASPPASLLALDPGSRASPAAAVACAPNQLSKNSDQDTSELSCHLTLVLVDLSLSR
jgi:hypothetical protein